MPMFVSQHALTVAVVNQWATTAGSSTRRNAVLGGGLVDCTTAFLAACAATEEMSGYDPAKLSEPTSHESARDCWFAAVTITLTGIQGVPSPNPRGDVWHMDANGHLQPFHVLNCPPPVITIPARSVDSVYKPKRYSGHEDGRGHFGSQHPQPHHCVALGFQVAGGPQQGVGSEVQLD